MEFGCSSFTWQTTDGRHLLGRTYDAYGDLRRNRVMTVPRGFAFAAGLTGAADTVGRYAFVGMAVRGFGAPIAVDGVNESGLMGALLQYPGCAVYGTQDVPGRIGVHPACLVTWMLSQCADLDALIAALPQLYLLDETVQGEPMEVHYLFSDRTGETVILEPDAGGLTLHRQTIGVLTNSPDYLWQRTNLRTYAEVRNRSRPPQTIAGYPVCAFAQDMSGGFGLPGDYTSPSRFVRLAFLKQFAVRGADELDGVTRMYDIFSAVTVPEGLLGTDTAPVRYAHTLCTTVLCAESGMYYFSPMENRRISAVRVCPDDGAPELYAIPTAQDIAFLQA